MMKKRTKINMRLVFLIFFLLCSYFISSASERRGSIKITLTDGAEGTSREGVVFGYCKVEDVELSEIKNTEELANVANTLAEKEDPKGMVTTDSKGVAEIFDLETGVYLLKPVDIVNYDEIAPTLVKLPYWSDDTKEMLYDMTVVPKHTPVAKPVPKKKNVSKELPEIVQTGDETKVWVCVVVMFLSGIVLILYLMYKNKKD